MHDISILSKDEPIYTQSGRFGGGVFIVDSYDPTIIYMSNESISLLEKIKNIGANGEKLLLSDNEIKMINRMIEVYTKPKNKS